MGDPTNIYNFKALNYSNRGQMNFPHTVKQVQFGCMSTGTTSYNPGDTLTIQISSDDFLNPLGTFLDMTVDLSTSTALADDTTFKFKLLQLDSSASSFISQMVITLRDTEVERINNYDQLACILKDVTYDSAKRTMRDYEGNGGNVTIQPPNCSQTMQAIPFTNSGNILGMCGTQPTLDMTAFVDTNNRSNNSNAALPANYVTRNFVLNYTQTAFQGYQNQAGVTYNKGNDVNEVDQNWTDPARLIHCNAETYGLYQPFNPTFSNSGFEPWFSKTLYLRYMKNGLIKADNPLTQEFQVPLLSSFFGALLPCEQWKLIPMKYFWNLQLQFNLNPYALQTSWFTSDQSSRNYIMKNFSLRCEMVKIQDQNILAQVDQEYKSTGIVIPSQSFYYGPPLTCTNGVLPSSHLINIGCKSLKNFIFCFNSNDYTANANARKNYRLSYALTSCQLMCGTELYPPQAIAGQAGSNYGPVNNTEFIKNFFKCFGRHLSSEGGVINSHNYCVNCREFDPTSTNTYVTGNTQLGLFMENRVNGKCVFGIPLDPLNYEGKMWSGLDTTKSTPFSLLINNDIAVPFTRAVTLHTWLHHDYMIIVNPDGVTCIGRG